MASKLNCPKCKQIVSAKPLKEWKYKSYDVKRYKCESCESKFNLYQGLKTTFTIPKC